MALTPEDLAAISKLLEGQEQRLEGKIEASVEGLRGEMQEIKHEILAKMEQESKDTASLFEKTWEMIEENKKERNKRATYRS